MKRRQTTLSKILQAWLILFVMLFSCVEPIDFDVPPAQLLTVVEGRISDDPGPYTVTVSKGFSLDAQSNESTPVENATIQLYDDQGNIEYFTESEPGTYITGGLIQGEVGHTYYIRIETSNGQIYESEPEMLNPTGDLEAISFEYEERTREEIFGNVRADIFNIYIDGNSGPQEENFTRWKFTGTYKVLTYPELFERRISVYIPYKDPWPCSGYIVVGAFGGGRLEKRDECECCECWVNDFEPFPQLSDNQLVINGNFRNIKVGEVAVNSSTFYDKYLLEVEQMSMTRTSFEFFRLARAQKENASNIFQSTFGEIPGNIKGINTNDPIAGTFWATSIKKKSRFIEKSDLPIPVAPIEISTQPCYVRYQNASNIKPDGWD